MRTAPTILPHRVDQDIYLVLEDFGRHGRGWSEADEGNTDRNALIRDLLAGEYPHPLRIIAFNTAEGWSRDMTLEIADELRRRYVEYDEVPSSVLQFLERVRRS